MSATKFEIRRLNFGEILDEGFKLFRHGFRRFLFFQVLLYAPSIAIFAYALNAAGEGLLSSLEHGEMPPPGDLIAWAFSLIGSLLLLHGVVWPISTVALTSGVADTYLGRRWTIGTILIRALRMALRGI